MTAYKYYKLTVSKTGADLTTVPSGHYLAINEFEVRETVGGSNILIGSTVTTNGISYDANTVVENMIDGNTSTYAELRSNPQNPFNDDNQIWVQFELATAKEMREFRILSNPYPNEKPQIFSISGSVDGVVWNTIFISTYFMPGSITDKTVTIDSVLQGIVKTPDNREVTVKILRNSSSGLNEIGSIQTVNGNWSLQVDRNYKYYMLYIGSGLRPQADGEITPTVF